MKVRYGVRGCVLSFFDEVSRSLQGAGVSGCTLTVLLRSTLPVSESGQLEELGLAFPSLTGKAAGAEVGYFLSLDEAEEKLSG